MATVRLRLCTPLPQVAVHVDQSAHLDTVQSTMLGTITNSVPSRSRRIQQPVGAVRPPGESVLGNCVDVLFELGARHHQRKNGKVSAFVQVCGMQRVSLMVRWITSTLTPATGNTMGHGVVVMVQRQKRSKLGRLLTPLPVGRTKLRRRVHGPTCSQACRKLYTGKMICEL